MRTGSSISAAGGQAPASAAGGQTAVVSKPGMCEREVTVGKTTHRILHSWRPVDWTRRGHAEVFRDVVSVPHPKGARRAHRQERDLPAVLEAGGHRGNAGHV